jgi:hypothetical protein
LELHGSQTSFRLIVMEFVGHSLSTFPSLVSTLNRTGLVGGQIP